MAAMPGKAGKQRDPNRPEGERPLACVLYSQANHSWLVFFIFLCLLGQGEKDQELGKCLFPLILPFSVVQIDE